MGSVHSQKDLSRKILYVANEFGDGMSTRIIDEDRRLAQLDNMTQLWYERMGDMKTLGVDS